MKKKLQKNTMLAHITHKLPINLYSSDYSL